MKFSVNTGDLSNALTIATHALSARSTLPILEGILIETTDSGVSLTCSDGSMTITASAVAEIAADQKRTDGVPEWWLAVPVGGTAVHILRLPRGG